MSNEKANNDNSDEKTSRALTKFEKIKNTQTITNFVNTITELNKLIFTSSQTKENIDKQDELVKNLVPSNSTTCCLAPNCLYRPKIKTITTMVRHSYVKRCGAIAAYFADQADDIRAIIRYAIKYKPRWFPHIPRPHNDSKREVIDVDEEEDRRQAPPSFAPSFPLTSSSFSSSNSYAAKPTSLSTFSSSTASSSSLQSSFSFNVDVATAANFLKAEIINEIESSIGSIVAKHLQIYRQKLKGCVKDVFDFDILII